MPAMVASAEEHARELHAIVSCRVSELRFDIDLTLKAIDAITTAVKIGDAAHAAELPQLSTRMAALKRKLVAEEQSLGLAERDLSAARKVAQEAELQELVMLAENEHAQFADCFRQACLSLGNICSIVEKAGTLGNSLGLPMRGSLLRDRLVGISMPPDHLLPKLLDAGLEPMPGVGFNWAIRGIPLRNRFKSNQGEEKL
jgi:hypothetical protein